MINPRRWLKLGLRGVLILIALFAIGLGWWVNSAREQQSTVAALQARDEYSFTYSDGTVIDGHRGVSEAHTVHPRGRNPWWPVAWLESRLGRDFVHNLVALEVGGDLPYQAPMDRKGILAAVASFPHLRSLRLDIRGLTDGEARQISRLSSVEDLTLNINESDLSDEGLRALGTMTNLKQLSVWGDFSDDGLAALSGLVRLESLSFRVASNRLVGPPPGRVSGRGVAHLVRLPRLRELQLESTIIDGAGIEAISSLIHLEELCLEGGVYADKDLQPLARLSHLKTLVVDDSGIDGTGLSFLKGLPKLSELALIGCPNLGDAAIPHLTSVGTLVSLSIMNTKMTAPSLEQFAATGQLKQLWFQPKQPGDRVRLQHALPGCRITGG